MLALNVKLQITNYNKGYLMANLHISDCSQIVADVQARWHQYCLEFDLDDPNVIVNNSGGKDSGVTDLLARHILGDNFRSVAADTGNEHRFTIEHLKTLHLKRGGRPVEIVSMDYPQHLFDSRLLTVKKNWSKKQRVAAGAYRGVVMPSLTREDTKFAEQWRIAAARLGWGEYATPFDAFLSAFKRTGNPFLDMCLLHGGFPLGRQRFCTEELKMQLVFDKILTPLLDTGHDVVQWSGVRGDESEKRASYPEFEEDKRCPTGQLYNFLPIHKLSVQQVFALYKYFGVDPNPLYSQGMERVGCMPCILVTKSELAQIATRFPEEIERIAQWELLVTKVSRWMHWMIVGHVDRRQFKRTLTVNGKRTTVISNLGNVVMLPAYTWPKTEAYRTTSMLGPRGRVTGGGVYDAIAWAFGDEPDQALSGEQCSSRYGVCG